MEDDEPSESHGRENGAGDGTQGHLRILGGRNGKFCWSVGARLE